MGRFYCLFVHIPHPKQNKKVPKQSLISIYFWKTKTWQYQTFYLLVHLNLYHRNVVSYTMCQLTCIPGKFPVYIIIRFWLVWPLLGKFDWSNPNFTHFYWSHPILADLSYWRSQTNRSVSCLITKSDKTAIK